MILKKIIQLLKAYKFSIIEILIYEIYFIIRGFKGNSYDINKNERATDNIPCPYFFLNRITNFIKEKKINSLIDLGCGSGRSIFFFNKNYKINYFGIEYFDRSYQKCRKLFENNSNVAIINEDFMNFDFTKIENDCYFINDPLKSLDEFNNLILKIIEKNEQLNKSVFLILVNVNKDKLKILKEYELIHSTNKGSRGFYIFSNSKKNNELQN